MAVPVDAAVCLSNVRKAYGPHVVLENLNLTVRSGEHLVIIGPSGSGKTTILRCLMLLDDPDTGSIEVGGVKLSFGGRKRPGIRERKALRAHVGLVFQQFNLFPHMTALQNVALALRHVRQLARADAEIRATRVLEQVGLGECIGAYPQQLSAGQQQRVAIARAIALEPTVMLFDEVTSALDPELVGEVLKVIRRLAEERGMTMILATDEMEFAREVADRIVFMEEGRIIESGPPWHIFDAPQAARTRRFLGTLRDR